MWSRLAKPLILWYYKHQIEAYTAKWMEYSDLEDGMILYVMMGDGSTKLYYKIKRVRDESKKLRMEYIYKYMELELRDKK